MFSSRFKRHAAQFAISAALAVGTPAAAAGLVEGVRVAATTVDQAGSGPTVVPDDSAAPVAPIAAPQPAPVLVATHEPTPLGHPGVAPANIKPAHTPHSRNPTP